MITAQSPFPSPSISPPGDVVQTGVKVDHDLGSLLLSSSSYSRDGTQSRDLNNLSSLLSSSSSSYSRDGQRITLFKNLGLALEDLITAHMVYQNYLTENQG